MGDISISVDTSGLRDRIRRMKTQIQDNLPMAVQEMGDTIGNTAKQLALYKTGTLRDSIETRDIHMEGDSCIGVLGPSDDVPYAAIQEFGGFVFPKEGNNVLHWVDDMGIDIFAKYVYIPAHPYMRPAYDQEKENAIEAGKKILLAGIK